MFRFDYKGVKKDILVLIKSKYFYIGLVVLLIGLGFNFLSQIYLHNFLIKGGTLPPLSDIILNNLPYYNLSWIYDGLILVMLGLFVFDIVYMKKYKSVPYFFLLFGIFYILRSVFVVLTPFGNPQNFIGSTDIFKGFSKYELGLYPSGHIGFGFLYFWFSEGIFKWISGIFSVFIIIALFLSRGHYSIDILSAIIFSYAICCFGEKYFKKFRLN